MNDNFDNQKEFLLSLKQEINLLRQQVDYLLRNEKPLGLLDLDVLMNRTHTVYDMLCSMNLNENEEEQDFDIDPDAFSGLFGSLMQTEQQEEVSEPVAENETIENEPDEDFSANEFQEDNQLQEETNAEEIRSEEAQNPEDTIQEEQSAPAGFAIETPAENEKEAAENFNPMDEPIKDEPIAEEMERPKSEKEPLSDEFGFFFRFDEVADEMSEKHEDQPVQEEKIVHFVEEVPEDEIPERDLVDGEHLVHDNPFVMPVVEDYGNIESQFEKETVESPKEELPVFEPVEMPQEEEAIEEPEPAEDYREVAEEPEQQEENDEPMPFVNDFEKDDSEYEFDTPETLVEHLQHDDNSLAAKLQQKSINELKAAIGINDKFLFVNELFGGSMEKYNRSIENLDDMKTLNGTLIYLNELKVELQWNSSNEAYQKLLNLIHRKFGD